MATNEQVLNTPMTPEDNDAGASTVRGYLIKLLALAWEETEGFDGKRPFGNSSWEYEVIDALAVAGFIVGERDEDGCWNYTDEQTDAARVMVDAAIQSLGSAP